MTPYNMANMVKFGPQEMANMVKYGPLDMKGLLWNERGKDQILQILISHGDDTINSIQFVSAEDKKVICSRVHGEPHGLNLDIVTFDYPKEYLTSISGQYSHGRLVSIAFDTNMHMHGPFGNAYDDDDNNDADDDYSKFVCNFRPKSSFGGFHGSVWNYCVHAIGVYIKLLRSLPGTETHIHSVNSDDDQST